MSEAVKAPAKGRKKKKKPGILQISAETRILDAVTLCQEAGEIMAAYGLHCFTCALGGQESLAEGCALHGFSEEMITALVDDLNESMARQPKRKPIINVTEAAANALMTVAKKEGHEGQGLLIISQPDGSFCLEFCRQMPKGHRAFFHSSVPQVRVYASLFSLARIGGATIDFRDERFKLDLP